MSITKEQAMTCNEFHVGSCMRLVGTRGGITTKIESWRRSGQTKTWKTRPTEWAVPVKYGLYTSSYISHTNAEDSHVAQDCPLLRQIDCHKCGSKRDWGKNSEGQIVCVTCGTPEGESPEEADGVQRVLFRKWHNGDIIAILPDAPANPGMLLMYEHVGQHGEGDYHHLVRKTTAARPIEYAALLKELISEPYKYKLRVVQRIMDPRRNPTSSEINHG